MQDVFDMLQSETFCLQLGYGLLEIAGERGAGGNLGSVFPPRPRRPGRGPCAPPPPPNSHTHQLAPHAPPAVVHLFPELRALFQQLEVMQQ